MTQLTKNFTLDELIYSSTAKAKGIDNTPDPLSLKNIKETLAPNLQKIRDFLGHPINVNSGYRCSKLNKAVGGSQTSAHSFGLAVDFTCSKFGTPFEICRALEKSGIKFDQLIYEQGANDWVHIGFSSKNRQQVMSKKSGLPYVNGLVKR